MTLPFSRLNGFGILENFNCEEVKTGQFTLGIKFKVYGYTFILFPKGDNFREHLFASMEDEVFLKWDLLIKE